MEPLTLLLCNHHDLADVDPIPLASLENETLLLFPRELAPGYYDRVIAACEQSGFQPRVKTFTDPPPQAMVARLRATREVGLPPAAFAVHAAAAEPGVAARKIVQPEIRVVWSILWAARTQSAAVARFLESARRCSEENGWLLSSHDMTSAEAGAGRRPADAVIAWYGCPVRFTPTLQRGVSGFVLRPAWKVAWTRTHLVVQWSKAACPGGGGENRAGG